MNKLYKNAKWLQKMYWVHEYSTRDIAKICGISQSALWWWIKKYNIKTRPPGKSQYTKRCQEKLSKARNLQEKERNPNWRGGRFRKTNGYILIKAYGHPNANKNGYVLEHRLVAEKALGRFLNKEEKCHHRNGILDDNRWENLFVFENNSAHHKYEHFLRRDLKNAKIRPEILQILW